MPAPARGCTYANFYDNLGYGVGAGQDPTFCLTSGTDGFDVESLAVSNGTLYWSAIDKNGVSSGVYGRTPGQPPSPWRPLALPGNSNGLRTSPLPQLYVDDSLHRRLRPLLRAPQIVRGERAANSPASPASRTTHPPRPAASGAAAAP